MPSPKIEKELPTIKEEFVEDIRAGKPIEEIEEIEEVDTAVLPNLVDEPVRQSTVSEIVQEQVVEVDEIIAEQITATDEAQAQNETQTNVTAVKPDTVHEPVFKSESELDLADGFIEIFCVPCFL